MSTTREWDAASYDALPLPHVGWGLRVLDRMDLVGDELVLDAGCGTGRDAAALLARWPGVRVIGLDGSQQMLDQARSRLGDGVTLVRADLTQPLPLPEPVDAVMSVAAFHWIRDHTALFEHLHAAMKPGASLTTDCGGRGNVAGVNRALAQVTGELHDGWEFAGVEDTRARLEAIGFEVAVGRVCARIRSAARTPTSSSATSPSSSSARSSTRCPSRSAPASSPRCGSPWTSPSSTTCGWRSTRVAR